MDDVNTATDCMSRDSHVTALHSPPPPSGSDKASFHFFQLNAADFKKLLGFMCHTLFNHLILSLPFMS